MMAAKNVKFGDAGLDKLVEGINVVANAVKVRHPVLSFSEEGQCSDWGVGLWGYVLDVNVVLVWACVLLGAWVGLALQGRGCRPAHCDLASLIDC